MMRPAGQPGTWAAIRAAEDRESLPAVGLAEGTHVIDRVGHGACSPSATGG
jgi:hypothetical protein